MGIGEGHQQRNTRYLRDDLMATALPLISVTQQTRIQKR